VLKLVDAVELSVAKKDLLEFQARSMIMSRRVANLLQKELVDEVKKKFVEELVALKKKMDVDQAHWATKMKSFEEEIKKWKRS